MSLDSRHAGLNYDISISHEEMSLLGIDLGTTGCKAAAYSKDGRCLAQGYREYGAVHPRPGRVELDSRDVWEKVRQVIREVASGVGTGAQTGAKGTATEQTTGRHAAGSDPITALCVSSFGEAFVPVSRDREILGASILNTDVRGAEYADALARDFGQEAFYRINPNILGPQYSLPKLMWLRDHEPELFGRTDFFLFWADLVPFLLGCEPSAANSLANRSLLFDLKKNDWSDKLLAWSGIERKKLGRIVTGGTVIGTVDDRAAAELGLPRGVLVVAGGHDQCLNALGAGCIEPGKAVCGIGTFECITPTYGEIREPMRMLELGLNMEHHVLPGLYVSFLYNQAGSLVKWFRDTFAAADAAPEGIDIYAMLDREMPEAPTELLGAASFRPAAVAGASGRYVRRHRGPEDRHRARRDPQSHNGVRDILLRGQLGGAREARGRDQGIHGYGGRRQVGCLAPDQGGYIRDAVREAEEHGGEPGRCGHAGGDRDGGVRVAGRGGRRLRQAGAGVRTECRAARDL